MRRTAVLLFVLAALVLVALAWLAEWGDVPESHGTDTPTPVRAEPSAGGTQNTVGKDEPARPRVDAPDVEPGSDEDDGVRRRAVVVVDEAGEPVAGARLRSDDGDGDDDAPFVETDDDGHATLHLPEYGDLLAVSPGHVRETHEYDCGIEGGEPIRIVLRECRRISGLVVDGEGRPAAGARVAIETAAGYVAQHVVDEQGRFVFDGLDPDPNSGARLSAELDDRVCAEVSALPGELDVRLVLHRPATVRGVVVFADGTAAADAMVHSPSSRGGASTDDAGRFALGDVVPGRVELRATLPIQGVKGVRLVGTATCDVTESRSVEGLRVVLGPDPERSVVRVRVLGPDGAPARRAFVYVFREGASDARAARDYTTTDDDGIALARVHVPPATPVVIAAGGCPDILGMDAVAPDGQATEGGAPQRTVELRLGEPGRLVLKAVDETGTDVPVDASHVEQSFQSFEEHPGGGFVLTAIDQFAATLQVPGFAPYQVLLDPPHPRPRVETVTLARDAPCTVTGTLVGEGGATVADETVVSLHARLHPGTGPQQFDGDSTTLDEGAFRLSGFFRRDVRLQVFVPPDWMPVVDRSFRVEGDTDLGELVVPARRRWRGRVTNAAGAPLAGAAIAVRSPTGKELDATTTRPDGSFHITVAPELPVTVEVERRGYAPREIETTSCADEPLEIVLARE